jgi:putative FmdB family regulatory protein
VPIYEYTCRKCEQKFEKLVRSMNSTDPISCPGCGSRQTARQLSVFAVSAEAGRSAPPARCGGCAGAEGCPMMED